MRKFNEDDENQHLELLKSVAQAWHARVGDSNPTNELDAAGRAARSPLRRPSRFKLEAAAAASKTGPLWDFSRSLWDAYEIVTIAKQLEVCNLTLDQQMPSPSYGGGGRQKGKRRWESKNSLRNLFNKAGSRRFDGRDLPEEGE
ncbi:uncharacterized protein LOC110018943 [Phalaenopsis equestris]|uniref:uncharacterized protein LOC110018943 n=1 Tax=Phalaenopsis equestris TaxID=78828 RepID=UPI0009E1CE37|nr:uncharacterized protein LOC110018943 [Phalaenopsis equestris]